MVLKPFGHASFQTKKGKDMTISLGATMSLPDIQADTLNF